MDLLELEDSSSVPAPAGLPPPGQQPGREGGGAPDAPEDAGPEPGLPAAPGPQEAAPTPFAAAAAGAPGEAPADGAAGAAPAGEQQQARACPRRERSCNALAGRAAPAFAAACRPPAPGGSEQGAWRTVLGMSESGPCLGGRVEAGTTSQGLASALP